MIILAISVGFMNVLRYFSYRHSVGCAITGINGIRKWIIDLQVERSSLLCTGRVSLNDMTEIIIEILLLMGCCAALIGNLLPTFRDKLSVTSSGCKRTKKTA